MSLDDSVREVRGMLKQARENAAADLATVCENAAADLATAREKAIDRMTAIVATEGEEALLAALIRTASGPAEILLLSAHRATRDARKL